MGSSERDEPRRLPAQARPAADAGAVRRARARRTLALRHPAPRRAAPPLRLPARAGRRARELGGAEGRAASSRASAIWPSTSRITRSSTRDFEGVIPAGQYGAGTVEIWDRGTYELLEEKRDGGLTVRLHGERLDGVWTLVPAHLDGDEKNWLLLRKDAERRARARLRPMLATLTEALPTGDGLAVRAEVGRLPRDRRRRRRRGRRSRAATATTSRSASARSRGRSSTPSARPPR